MVYEAIAVGARGGEEAGKALRGLGRVQMQVGREHEARDHASCRWSILLAMEKGSSREMISVWHGGTIHEDRRRYRTISEGMRGYERVSEGIRGYQRE